MVNRRFMRHFIASMLACGLIVLVLWPQPAAASVEIVYFRAVSGQNKITLEWETETETDFLGFRIYRSATENLADATPITSLIPAQGQPPTGGATYRYDDTNVVNNVIYYYWLGSIDNGHVDPNAYEGPRSATTLAGTTINTPVPTSPGSTPATATNTPAASATATSSAVTPTPTSQGATAAPSPTVTPQPSPTIDLTPSRIPSGTFPQPPTPTRFSFTQTPGAVTTNVASSSNSGNNAPGATSGNGETVPTTTPNGDVLGAPIVPVGPADSNSEPTAIAILPDVGVNPDNIGVAVLGQADDIAASQSGTTDILPPPGTASGAEANTAISPLLIMGLLVGSVFTFGGAITTVFILARKR